MYNNSSRFNLTHMQSLALDGKALATYVGMGRTEIGSFISPVKYHICVLHSLLINSRLNTYFVYFMHLLRMHICT